jgi:membrane-associated phospholipid phosphatase
MSFPSVAAWMPRMLAAGRRPTELTRRKAITAGALLVLTVVVYVVALKVPLAVQLDGRATLDPLTGQLRTVVAVFHVLSPAYVGTAVSAVLLAIALAAQGLRHCGVAPAVLALATVGGVLFTGETLKWALGAFEPIGGMTEHGSAATFPSVHAAIAMSLATQLAIFASPRWNKTAVFFAVTYPAMMGITILLTGWHYPTDVVGGYLLGAAWVIALGGLPVARRPLTDRRLIAASRVGIAGAAGILLAVLVGYAVAFLPQQVETGAFLTGAGMIIVAQGCAVLAVTWATTRFAPARCS